MKTSLLQNSDPDSDPKHDPQPLAFLTVNSYLRFLSHLLSLGHLSLGVLLFFLLMLRNFRNINGLMCRLLLRERF